MAGSEEKSNPGSVPQSIKPQGVNPLRY